MVTAKMCVFALVVAAFATISHLLSSQTRNYPDTIFGSISIAIREQMTNNVSGWVFENAHDPLFIFSAVQISPACQTAVKFLREPFYFWSRSWEALSAENWHYSIGLSLEIYIHIPFWKRSLLFPVMNDLVLPSTTASNNSEKHELSRLNQHYVGSTSMISHCKSGPLQLDICLVYTRGKTKPSKFISVLS